LPKNAKAGFAAASPGGAGETCGDPEGAGAEENESGGSLAVPSADCGERELGIPEMNADVFERANLNPPSDEGAGSPGDFEAVNLNPPSDGGAESPGDFGGGNLNPTADGGVESPDDFEAVNLNPPSDGGAGSPGDFGGTNLNPPADGGAGSASVVSDDFGGVKLDSLCEGAGGSPAGASGALVYWKANPRPWDESGGFGGVNFRPSAGEIVSAVEFVVAAPSAVGSSDNAGDGPSAMVGLAPSAPGISH
jgi:hypothetical protein